MVRVDGKYLLSGKRPSVGIFSEGRFAGRSEGEIFPTFLGKYIAQERGIKKHKI